MNPATKHQAAREMPLKQWLFERATLAHVTPNAIWYRLRRGVRHEYNLRERKINRRVILVSEIEP